MTRYPAALAGCSALHSHWPCPVRRAGDSSSPAAYVWRFSCNLERLRPHWPFRPMWHRQCLSLPPRWHHKLRGPHHCHRNDRRPSTCHQCWQSPDPASGIHMIIVQSLWTGIVPSIPILPTSLSINAQHAQMRECQIPRQHRGIASGSVMPDYRRYHQGTYIPNMGLRR